MITVDNYEFHPHTEKAAQKDRTVFLGNNLYRADGHPAFDGASLMAQEYQRRRLYEAYQHCLMQAIKGNNLSIDVQRGYETIKQNFLTLAERYIQRNRP